MLEREQGTGKGNRELCVSAKHTTQTEKTKHNYPEDFESFWNNYPRLRRKQKLTALTAWKSALKKTTSENLISKGIEYANSETGRGDFVAMPATWLNGGCWDDDPQSWNPTEKTAKCEVMNPDDYNLKKMGPEAFARMKADERARGLST